MQEVFISAYSLCVMMSALLHWLVIEISGNKVCESSFKVIEYHEPVINSGFSKL